MTSGVPTTVATALEDRPIAGTTCLEAGAGVGNATAGLLAAGADRVYALTDEREHARTVRERTDDPDRTCVLAADLRETPLPADSVDVVTAHGLFNVVPPADLASIASELTRVAAPGAHLVVDDYAPLPDGADVGELFAVENAASELATGRPALTFYPAETLRRLFAGYGWAFERERTLLDPVPWTERHVDAHVEAARESAAELDDDLTDPLAEEVERLVDAVNEESIGRMYSVAMRLPD